MNISQMNDDQFKLLFAVRRSVRYHDRRRAFFELMHRITAALTILMAGSILFDIGKNGETAQWLIVLSVAAALLSVLDMVIGYASKADLHRSLKVRFGELEIAIISGGDSDSEWNQYQVKRLEIEQDEPPIYRALDVLCHNELVKALGLDTSDAYKVGLFHRLTSHLYYWPNF